MAVYTSIKSGQLYTSFKDVRAAMLEALAPMERQLQRTKENKKFVASAIDDQLATMEALKVWVESLRVMASPKQSRRA